MLQTDSLPAEPQGEPNKTRKEGKPSSLTRGTLVPKPWGESTLLFLSITLPLDPRGRCKCRKWTAERPGEKVSRRRKVLGALWKEASWRTWPYEAVYELLPLHPSCICMDLKPHTKGFESYKIDYFPGPDWTLADTHGEQIWLAYKGFRKEFKLEPEPTHCGLSVWR